MILNRSITTKFITAVFLALLAGQIIGATVFIMQIRSSLLASLEKQITIIGNISAGISVGPLMTLDYSPLDTYLNEVMKDDQITSIHFRDSKGTIIREKITDADGSLQSINPLLIRKAMELKVPVITGGEKIGEVEIHYNANTFNRIISNNFILILGYQTVVLLLVALIMASLFKKYVKQPVLELNSTIDQITSGDLSITMPDLGKNEIGSIAEGIGFLEAKLSDVVTKLNTTVMNVSMAIRQVTATYTHVIGGITKQSEAVRDIIKSTQAATAAQTEIGESAEKLSAFSTENVSSLLEMKATADEIAANTLRLFKASENAYSSVLQMSQTSKIVAQNTNNASSAVESTSASVEEIGASIREVEDHARASSHMAARVKEIASDIGMLSVVNAVEGMENIAAEVKKSSDIVKRLGTRSADIEKVLSVIRDVTDQTNLLSLNAAILAAQAGEYGKSFSVVADEIRGLSERTATSTREIGGIVKNIQKDISEAVRAIDNANSRVEDGNTLVIKVGDALKETLTAAEHSSEMTKAIERATEEQSQGLRQITFSMDEIQKQVASVTKSSKEQDKALSYLLDGVSEVKEVADMTKRGTAEQAVGTRMISKNIELANDRIAKINEAVINQKRLNDEIIAAMEQINILGKSTISDMEDVSQSLKTLTDEIDILKKDVEVFKIA